MDRKKELKEQYKRMKPDMGIFMIRSKINNRCHLEVSQNLKGALNSSKFKLEAGNHPNRELQKEWKEQGEKNFTIDILEKLEYDKEESKTDYKDELALLLMIWQEKLVEESLEFYRK